MLFVAAVVVVVAGLYGPIGGPGHVGMSDRPRGRGGAIPGRETAFPHAIGPAVRTKPGRNRRSAAMMLLWWWLLRNPASLPSHPNPAWRAWNGARQNTRTSRVWLWWLCGGNPTLLFSNARLLWWLSLLDDWHQIAHRA